MKISEFIHSLFLVCHFNNGVVKWNWNELFLKVFWTGEIWNLSLWTLAQIPVISLVWIQIAWAPEEPPVQLLCLSRPSTELAGIATNQQCSFKKFSFEAGKLAWHLEQLISFRWLRAEENFCAPALLLWFFPAWGASQRSWLLEVVVGVWRWRGKNEEMKDLPWGWEGWRDCTESHYLALIITRWEDGLMKRFFKWRPPS